MDQDNRTDLHDAEKPSTSTQEPTKSDDTKSDKKPDTGLFECNICLDNPTDPVVSFCGHLFCWPCLHGWLSMREPEQQQTCPVCKAAIDKDKVVPLYGRNSKQEDPRNKTIPPRPRGRRTEAPPNQNVGPDFVPFPGFFGFGNGGFHMTVGFGSLPLNLLFAAFNLNQGLNGGQQAQRTLVERILLFAAFVMIFLIIFV